MEHIINILVFILKSFLHIWPYLLITIPLAVAVNLSGASGFITKAFNAKPVVSIFLATMIGAISPFCSCGVIPVITSLLIGGVPLGPVMSFWIASPSMDPEIFMLSVASVGWKISIWRLVATFIISFSAGMLTHIAQRKGFLGESVLRNNVLSTGRVKTINQTAMNARVIPVADQGNDRILCCVTNAVLVSESAPTCSCPNTAMNPVFPALQSRIIKESWKSSVMVVKFMAVAFLINAIIAFYIPPDLISGIAGTNNAWSVLLSTLIGIPFYTSNLTALPLVGSLISMGMNQGAALAFLIAGPVTTLPAMMAVWGIVNRKVFMAYVAFGLVGSLLFGYLYMILY